MTRPMRVCSLPSDTSKTFRLGVRMRALPVIVIPDILGTRLTDPETDALAWNPLGAPFGDSPGDWTVNAPRLADVPNALRPDVTHLPKRQSQRDDARGIVDYWHLVTDWYGPLCKALRDLSTDSTKKYKTRLQVYCFGYDWRQDNTVSAMGLMALVERALRETGESRVVLVAHGMGGLIARYYCKALGGEARVLKTILMASPLKGMPEAYLHLKDGLGGFNPRELFNDIVHGNVRGAIYEVARGAAELAQAAASASSAADGARSFFGDLYPLLCVATGRQLTRDLTRSWVRLFPSVYQLMPGQAWCRTFPLWLGFDPMQTGCPATGYLVAMPTSGEALTAASMTRAVASMAADVSVDIEALGRGDPPPTTARAHRNSARLGTLLGRVLRGLPMDSTEALMSAMEAGRFLGQRVGQMFLDSISPRALYTDIYTGLTDSPAERPLCGANLTTAFQLDAALTVAPREEPPLRPTDVLGALLEQLGHELEPVGDAMRESAAVGWNQERAAWYERLHGQGGAERFDELERQRADDKAERAKVRDDEEQAERADAALSSANAPRVYVHPCTSQITSSEQRCRVPGGLAVAGVESCDDSNTVHWYHVPYTPPMPGDGAVPLASAVPEERELSSPLARVAYVSLAPAPEKPPAGDAVPTAPPSGGVHAGFCAQPAVLEEIKNDFDEALFKRLWEG